MPNTVASSNQRTLKFPGSDGFPHREAMAPLPKYESDKTTLDFAVRRENFSKGKIRNAVSGITIKKKRIEEMTWTQVTVVWIWLEHNKRRDGWIGMRHHCRMEVGG